MLGISLATLSVLWAGAFVGALAGGGAGFAFAVAASAIWLHALDPLQTTALTVACGSILHFALVWPIRRSIDGPRLAPFLLGAMIGVPLGVVLLTHVNPLPLKLVLGTGLVAYALYALLAPRLPHVAGGAWWRMPGWGFWAVSSAGLAAIPACCQPSGPSCAAGRRRWHAVCTSPSSCLPMCSR